MLAVGLLPIFEQLFKITTEITLLELTDFNHPLLRRMQLEALGTYHHSLMVANLAENAAAEIGASPLLCRGLLFLSRHRETRKARVFCRESARRSEPARRKIPP